MRILLLTFFAVGLLASCQPTKEQDPVLSRISEEQFEKLMAQDYNTFDQTMDDGWRQYHDDLELQIRLVEEYMARHPEQEDNLVFHLGQLHGMNGNYEKAIPLFRKKIMVGDSLHPIPQAMNYYIQGTIAFMERDSVTFDLNMDSLRNHSETMNLNVMERMRANFDKSYREAY